MSSDYTFPPGVPVNPVRPIPDGEAPISIFGYIPNRAFAIVALVTFCVAVLVHTYYLVRVRGTRTFQALMAFGALCEVVGYAARLSASKNPFIVVKFVIQYFFSNLILPSVVRDEHRADTQTNPLAVVVSPVFFQAAFYIALADALRLLEGGGRTLLGFNPKILVAVMITADVVTTIVQICGAALIGVAESSTYRDGKSSTVTSDQANDILLAGLSLQVSCLRNSLEPACNAADTVAEHLQTASFLAFLILLAVCISRSRKTSIAARLPGRFTAILFLASLLVFLRTTFRLAETAEGELYLAHILPGRQRASAAETRS